LPFRNERRLKDEQITVLRQWVEAGMPEGDPAQMPAAPTFADGWALGKPDLVVKMPKAYHVPAEGRDVYRNFAVSLGLTEDKWVKAIDFRPSAPSVVHHTLFFLDTTGTARKKEGSERRGWFQGRDGWAGPRRGGPTRRLARRRRRSRGPIRRPRRLGSSAPRRRSLPDGLAYRLPKGSDLILSTHFHPSGRPKRKPRPWRSTFADKPPVQRFTGIQLPFGFGILRRHHISPAGKKDFAIEDSFVLPVDCEGLRHQRSRPTISPSSSR